VLDFKYMLLNRATNKRHALLRRCDASYAKCHDLEQEICELWDELYTHLVREGQTMDDDNSNEDRIPDWIITSGVIGLLVCVVMAIGSFAMSMSNGYRRGTVTTRSRTYQDVMVYHGHCRGANLLRIRTDDGHEITICEPATIEWKEGS